jgi:LPS sulfotransferase NodH
LPSSAYIICAGPRTGSNLLATALRNCEIAGQPFEFFEPTLADEPYMRDALRLGAHEVFTTFADRLEVILRGGSTQNGVFGATVHWHQMNHVLAAVQSESRGSLPPSARPTDPLRSFFPKLRLVWLRRGNHVAQGISHYLAIKSGRWQVSTDEAVPDPESGGFQYDFAEIHHQVDDAIFIDGRWSEFLKGSDDITLELTYEALSADFPGVLQRVLRHLGLSLSQRPLPSPRYRKQSTALSQTWEQRYLGEIGS